MYLSLHCPCLTTTGYCPFPSFSFYTNREPLSSAPTFFLQGKRKKTACQTYPSKDYTTFSSACLISEHDKKPLQQPKGLKYIYIYIFYSCYLTHNTRYIAITLKPKVWKWTRCKMRLKKKEKSLLPIAGNTGNAADLQAKGNPSVDISLTDLYPQPFQKLSHCI